MDTGASPCSVPTWMLAEGQQLAGRRLALARAAAAAARRRSAGTTAVDALGFRAAIRCESAELARAVADTFVDLASPADAEHVEEAAHSHEITAVAGRGESVALWADGVKVAGALRPGIVLPTISWLVNQGAIAHAPGLVLFHAAAVCSGDAGLLLPATSGSGKSTLAAALLASGLSYLSDELGALDLRTGRVVAYPKPISLDDGSFAALATPRDAVVRDRVVDGATASWTNLQWQVPARRVRAGAFAVSCRIVAVVFPARSAEHAARLRPLGRAALCARLVEHSMTVRREPQAHFAACAELATRVPGYELDVADLTAACTVLHELLESRPATSTVDAMVTRRERTVMPEVPVGEAYRPLVRAEVLTTEIDGEMVVFDAPSDTVLKMNQSATTVWSCCDGTATVDEIAADIAEVYDVDRAVVRAQVTDLVTQWSAKGLLANAIGDEPAI